MSVNIEDAEMEGFMNSLWNEKDTKDEFDYSEPYQVTGSII